MSKTCHFYYVVNIFTISLNIPLFWRYYQERIFEYHSFGGIIETSTALSMCQTIYDFLKGGGCSKITIAQPLN